MESHQGQGTIDDLPQITENVDITERASQRLRLGQGSEMEEVTIGPSKDGNVSPWLFTSTRTIEEVESV